MRIMTLSLICCVACDEPGGRSAGTTNTTGTTIGTADTSSNNDTFVPNDEAEAVCERWRTTRDSLREGTWTGSVSSCDPGDVLSPGRESALASVNLYRELAGLPPVEQDDDKNLAAQHCALLMEANGDIEHEVPASWDCFDNLGSQAAGLSNLATTAAVTGIDLFMTDTGVGTLGHRRWILSNSLGPIGIGSTARYSCLHVIGGDGNADNRWTAWPPPGFVPHGALEHGPDWMSTDAAGWSIQSDTIDLDEAEVTVIKDGTIMPIELRRLAPYYGSSYGLGIVPDGWATEPGATYHVAVRGLLEDIDYSTTVLDCD